MHHGAREELGCRSQERAGDQRYISCDGDPAGRKLASGVAKACSRHDRKHHAADDADSEDVQDGPRVHDIESRQRNGDETGGDEGIGHMQHHQHLLRPGCPAAPADETHGVHESCQKCRGHGHHALGLYRPDGQRRDAGEDGGGVEAIIGHREIRAAETVQPVASETRHDPAADDNDEHGVGRNGKAGRHLAQVAFDRRHMENDIGDGKRQ
ncbi:hypothetical protein D3C71_713500 [compost metagenome]